MPVRRADRRHRRATSATRSHATARVPRAATASRAGPSRERRCAALRGARRDAGESPFGSSLPHSGMLGTMSLRSHFETLVRTAPPEQVADRGVEVDPKSVGLDRKTIDAIWRATIGAYRTGLYPALALCIRRRGQVVFDRSIGHITGNAPVDP